MPTCQACFTELSTFDFQSRSADEAHTTVTTCPKCPIDMSRIFRHRPAPLPPPRFSRPKHTRPVSADDDVHVQISTCTVLSVEVPKDHCFRSLRPTNNHLCRPVAVRTSRGGVPELGLRHTAGPMERLVTTVSDTRSVGLCATSTAYAVYSGRWRNAGLEEKVYAQFAQLDSVGKVKTYAYKKSSSRNDELVVLAVLANDTSLSMQSYVLHELYSRGLCPVSLYAGMTPDSLARMSNLSPRAWDIRKPPSSGHAFTCKPDGERRWLVLYGVCWYSVEARRSKGIRGWICIGEPVELADKPTVIDVEYMATSRSVLIDMLTDHDGQFSPESRDLAWVLAEYSAVVSTYSFCPVEVRAYFDNYGEALVYSEATSYPCDGVVAIADGSTSARKIKDVKSMELRLSNDGVMESEDGVSIMRLPPWASGMPPSSVIEVRFECHGSASSIIVHDLFVRTDKDLANSSTVVHEIISSCLGIVAPGENERRAALIWCNGLRSKIVREVSGTLSNKSIVLDAGTGTGQSLDSFEALEHTSFLLVEPDKDRCASIARRLRTKGYEKSPEEVISKVRALKSRSLKFCVVNCTLGELWACDDLRDLLFPELRAIVCTFSMHYLLTDLQQITEEFDIPVHGCAYTYDGVKVGQCLVDECGVTMRRVTASGCTVKWGKDAQYEEPCTVVSDYSSLGVVSQGSTLLEFPIGPAEAAVAAICSNVIIVTPRRRTQR